MRDFPHNPSGETYIMEKLCEYVRQGKMFVFPSNGIPVSNLFMSSPSTTVAKKLLDRTLSTENRVIWDGRRANLKCPKADYWPVRTPMADDLAKRYCYLKANAHGVEIIGTKRDIGAAFTRVRVRPDCATLFGTEFAHRGDPMNNVVFFYLVLPFGFAGSPGIFGRVMEGVQVFHQTHDISHPHLNGQESLSALVCIDDGMFMELRLGNRPQISVNTWELGARLFMGIAGISGKKLRIEGSRTTELVLLGFHIDLERGLISPPNPKITGAAHLLSSAAFNDGNYALGVKDVQELRGCIDHWSYTGRAWRWLIHPSNQRLGFADGSGLWIRCDDPDKWTSFWNAVQFMREIAHGESNWEILFAGVFSEIVGIAHELAMANNDRRITWFSAGATPSCIGGINWRTDELFAANPHEYILPLWPDTRTVGHISEVEFVVDVLRTTVWIEDSRTLIVCGLTDNMCSNMWIMSGKSKHGEALALTRIFHRWLLHQRFRLFSFYIRSEHNMSADFLSRASQVEIDNWDRENETTRVYPLESWLTF